MLELLTTDAFASWFSSLDAGTAEDVAATLEVIVQLGVSREAPGASEYLLWYQHPSVGDRFRVDTSKFSPEFVKFTQNWGRFLGYMKRVVTHLESKQFRAHLERISPADAEIVAQAVKRIRRLSTTRMLGMTEFQLKNRLTPFRAPTSYEAAALDRFMDEGEVREAYFAALAAAGFEVVDVAPRPLVLREITLRTTPPGLRLLYGIDETKNRGLVVLGEWLDRSFYGDSVRWAEGVWADFLGGRPIATQAPSAP